MMVHWKQMHVNYWVIILNRGSMPRKRKGRKWCNSTTVRNVTAWRHSRLRAHWLMAVVVVGGKGVEGEVCILHSPGIAASPISLLSIGGVCRRSLTAGKILFSGRQTCSLYLVLWLCDANEFETNIGRVLHEYTLNT